MWMSKVEQSRVCCIMWRRVYSTNSEQGGEKQNIAEQRKAAMFVGKAFILSKKTVLVAVKLKIEENCAGCG